MSAITLVPMSDNRVGPMLREWRQRRRVSQLELALDAGVSTRHLSFVETGRSKPSAEMVLTLADQLEVPLRQRNQLLLAAGYAPQYAARSLDDPELAQVRDALGRVLGGHEPYPALAVDQQWNLVASNAALGLLLEGVAPELLQPPANTLRVALHPEGMAPRVINLGQWRAHLLHRLSRQISVTGDPALVALHEELVSYPGPTASEPDSTRRGGDGRAAVAHRVRTVAVLQHGHDLRYRGRHHGVGAGDRGFLPGQRRHRRGAQRSGFRGGLGFTTELMAGTDEWLGVSGVADSPR